MKWPIRWRSSPICPTLVNHFQVIMEMVIFVIWQPFAISPPSGQKKTNCCSFKIKEISTYGSFNPPPQHFNGFCFFFTPLPSIHPIKTWHERNHPSLSEGTCQTERMRSRTGPVKPPLIQHASVWTQVHAPRRKHSCRPLLSHRVKLKDSGLCNKSLSFDLILSGGRFMERSLLNVAQLNPQSNCREGCKKQLSLQTTWACFYFTGEAVFLGNTCIKKFRHETGHNSAFMVLRSVQSTKYFMIAQFLNVNLSFS